MEDRATERWHFGDRFYAITLASAPDSMDLELDDPERFEQGPLMLASRDDETGDLTVRVFTDERLPLALLEQFVSEARLRLPPNT
jgi:hypothetical protein